MSDPHAIRHVLVLGSEVLPFGYKDKLIFRASARRNTELPRLYFHRNSSVLKIPFRQVVESVAKYTVFIDWLRSVVPWTIQTSCSF